jgi:hypothetical protein
MLDAFSWFSGGKSITGHEKWEKLFGESEKLESFARELGAFGFDWRLIDADWRAFECDSKVETGLRGGLEFGRIADKE